MENENKTPEITFPQEVMDAAVAEDQSVRDGTYTPPEDETTSSEEETESEETKAKPDSETNDDDEGTGDKDDEESPEGLLFEDYIKDGKSLYVTDKDGNNHDLKQVIEDHLNNLNWKKTNTEKNQDLSSREAALTAKAKELGTEAIVTALSENDEELLKSLDGWFDPQEDGKDPDPSKNPFRNISGQIREYSQAEIAKANETAEAALTKEYEELEQIDKQYKEQPARDELMALALDNRVTLKQAHELREAEGLAKEVKTLTAELKARNKELKELKAKKAPASEGLGPGEVGAGVHGSESDNGKVKDWDSQMKKAEKMFLGN